jgi:hypothetical protein
MVRIRATIDSISSGIFLALLLPVVISRPTVDVKSTQIETMLRPLHGAAQT